MKGKQDSLPRVTVLKGVLTIEDEHARSHYALLDFDRCQEYLSEPGQLRQVRFSRGEGEPLILVDGKDGATVKTITKAASEWLRVQRKKGR